ncbi:MAG TPA: RNA polymerase sigma factor [Pyrinomonadaceae bacterium]|nr:RNA polymerase sigma factor [Pyrinomonadaceae bacterium]
MEEDQALPLPRALALEEANTRRSGQSTEEVVTALYEQLRPSLFSYAYHLTGSARDAEDLVQIAFLQLFDQLNRRSDIRNMRGWLYRAVHSLAASSARVARRDSLIREWFSDLEPLDERTAEEDLMRAEEIEQALNLLGTRERHCLMLRAEGLSYQEIGDVLEISAKSVSVYLARGLKKFEAQHEDNK